VCVRELGLILWGTRGLSLQLANPPEIRKSSSVFIAIPAAIQNNTIYLFARFLVSVCGSSRRLCVFDISSRSSLLRDPRPQTQLSTFVFLDLHEEARWHSTFARSIYTRFLVKSHSRLVNFRLFFWQKRYFWAFQNTEASFNKIGLVFYQIPLFHLLWPQY